MYAGRMATEVSVPEIRLVVSDDQADLVRIIEQLGDAAGTALARVRGTGEFERALMLLAGQVFANGRAVQLLCVAGYANQAFPVARAMVEHAINISYIARDPGERSKRYWAHRVVVHAQVVDAMQRHGAAVGEIAQLREDAKDAARVLAPHKHWDAGVRLKARAEECGLRALYDIYYPHGSAFSHGDASMLDAFVNDDGTSMHFGPSPNGIGSVAGPVIAALFAVLWLVCRVFSDGELEKELARIAAMLPKDTKRLELREHFEAVRKGVAASSGKAS
jgi:hypothetical protein